MGLIDQDIKDAVDCIKRPLQLSQENVDTVVLATLDRCKAAIKQLQKDKAELVELGQKLIVEGAFTADNGDGLYCFECDGMINGEHAHDCWIFAGE